MPSVYSFDSNTSQLYYCKPGSSASRRKSQVFEQQVLHKSTYLFAFSHFDLLNSIHFFANSSHAVCLGNSVSTLLPVKASTHRCNPMAPRNYPQGSTTLGEQPRCNGCVFPFPNSDHTASLRSTLIIAGTILSCVIICLAIFLLCARWTKQKKRTEAIARLRRLRKEREAQLSERELLHDDASDGELRGR
jgi:hypothetical protein